VVSWLLTSWQDPELEAKPLQDLQGLAELGGLLASLEFRQEADADTAEAGHRGLGHASSLS
jgi:hypothetical protein